MGRGQLEYQKAYYEKNKVRIRVEHAAYYLLHKEDWKRRERNNAERRRQNKDKWARENPSKVRASVRRCRASYKESAINMYSNGDACCRWCGQADIDVLCLDHINDDGARNRKGRDFYRWLRNNDYPSGLQVLCANCNMKKEMCRHHGEPLSSLTDAAGGGGEKS